MIDSICLIKKNVNTSVLESSCLEYFWGVHPFSGFFMGICLIGFLRNAQNTYLASEISPLSSLLSMVLLCPGMPLTELLEALIPLDTEVIVFCMQILVKIFWEALCCYCNIPEMLPAYELKSVGTCPNLKDFPILYFLFFPHLFL